MPNVSTIPFIKPHFHTSAGAPATSYRLYAYDSTTQDAIPVYKDPGGTTAYPNPVVLNSRGEPDGMGLYLDNTKVYKMVLKTDLDAPVWTVNAVQGVNGNGGTSVPVINLPGYSVLGNDTENYGEAGPIGIANSITNQTDSRDIPNVGALVNYTSKYLENSGDHTYNGNLEVAGKMDANAIETDTLTINGQNINDIYVAKDGHTARSLVGNAGEDSTVEDIPLVNDLTSDSPNEIPSVKAVKTSIDAAVEDLEQQITQVDSGRVKVDESDTANYLESKLVQGNRVQITKIQQNGEDKLQLDLNLDDLKDIAYVFQAYSENAGWVYPTNGAIFTGYASDPVNFGEGFNVETGKFTATDSGYYHFDSSALIKQAGLTVESDCTMYLALYNSENELQLQSVGYVTTPPSGSVHPNATIAASANFHMTEGDYVCLVFNVIDAGTTISVNRVAFGGYSLDSANGASASGTPFKIAWYDRGGKLNPNQLMTFDDRQNQLYGSYNSTVKGTDDMPVGADSVALGARNKLGTNDSVAIGSNNETKGGSGAGLAYAFGNKNKVSAHDGYAFGYQNTVGNSYVGQGVAVGMDCKVDGSEIMAVGTDITLDGAASVVVGKDIAVKNASGNVIVGKDLTVNSSSYGRVIVGSKLADTDMHAATTAAFGTGPSDYMTLFGRYVDQFGGFGFKGRFIGFDENMHIKVTNEVSDIKFLADQGITPTEGQLAWNDLDHTLNIGLSGGSALQLGQEELVYAVNHTGQTISNGQVVQVSGSQGNRVVVEFAQATTAESEQVFIAVATQAIPNNGMGYFTRFGLVRDINTAAMTEGAILWVSQTAGELTQLRPAKPYSQIAVAIVTRAHQQNGSIMVSPYVVPRLSQLTDVDTTGATDGQALVYSADTGIWKPGDATGGVSDGKVKVSANDTANYLGTKFTSSDHSVDIAVGTSEIDLKVKVNSSESKFSTTPMSTAATGIIPFTGLEFGNWVVDRGSIIAPTSGTHQINAVGKILYTTEVDGSLAFKGTAAGQYSNVTNQKVAWSFADYGNWNTTKDRMTCLEDGKVQLNVSFMLYTSNAVGANRTTGDLSVRHYRANGSMLRQYVAATVLTGLASQSGYYYDSVNHSEVVDVLAGDYFEVHMTVSGTGYMQDARLTGGMLSNTHSTVGNTTAVSINHRTSAGSLKTSYPLFDAIQPYKGFETLSFGKIYEVEAGDRFDISWTAGANVTAITDVVLSGALTQTSTISSGSGGATIDGVQTFAIIAANTALATGHTSDQGSTYTSARIIPAGVCVANYISCFATQVGTFYGLRMGIYTPGSNGDVLIAQTAPITTLPQAGGIITLPVLYDASGNAIGSPIELQPNTSYMLAMTVKANGCQFLSYKGLQTNPPNHFGRKDEWNAQDPRTNLMITSAGFSQSDTYPWMSASK